jgi:hypothetical protein
MCPIGEREPVVVRRVGDEVSIFREDGKKIMVLLSLEVLVEDNFAGANARKNR